MYEDSRFAIHPHFRFFALNTKMQWRALQNGRVYMKQHPGDAQLSLDELRDMVGRQGETFSSRVLHYASSLRGTKQYWYIYTGNILVSLQWWTPSDYLYIPVYNFFKVSSKQIINNINLIIGMDIII